MYLSIVKDYSFFHSIPTIVYRTAVVRDTADSSDRSQSPPRGCDHRYCFQTSRSAEPPAPPFASATAAARRGQNYRTVPAQFCASPGFRRIGSTARRVSEEISAHHFFWMARIVRRLVVMWDHRGGVSIPGCRAGCTPSSNDCSRAEMHPPGADRGGSRRCS